MDTFNEVREEIRKKNIQIRELKTHRKESVNGYVRGLNYERWQARHFHIAWSEMRGRKREEIEQKCEIDPDERLIAGYKRDLQPAFDSWKKRQEEWEEMPKFTGLDGKVMQLKDPGEVKKLQTIKLDVHRMGVPA